MFEKELLEKYAELIVKSGVNVQKGQPVIVSCDPSSLEIANLVVKKAYEAGASIVKTEISDSSISKYDYIYRSDESLQEIPDWKIEENKWFQERNCCRIGIRGYNPDAMLGIDPHKMQIAQRAYAKKAGRDMMNYYSDNKGQWVVCGFPNLKWAKKIFPELNDEEALNKLWEEILKTVRVSKDNDPVKEWEEHNARIAAHCKILNDYNFKKLKYTNKLGTNLEIELPLGHIWCGGCEYTNNDKKVLFNPNMPTEEVFTAPQRDGINGKVYSTKPLISAGNLITDFWIEFKNGKVVDFDAKEGKDFLKALIESDEGSCYLGEVALVPYHSPISLSKILYFNTLFDENASCHLALGDAYATCVKGTDGKSEEELIKMGVNQSFVHCDFMVGSEDLSIVGIDQDGNEVPVFINGDFAF